MQLPQSLPGQRRVVLYTGTRLLSIENFRQFMAFSKGVDLSDARNGIKALQREEVVVKERKTTQRWTRI